MNRVPVPQGKPKIVGAWVPASQSEFTADLLESSVRLAAEEVEHVYTLDVAEGVQIIDLAPTRLYIVVDELLGDHLTLSVSLWPVIDSRGRARFPRVGGRWRIGAATADLGQFLFVHRTPDPERELRIGDVFSAGLVPGANLDELSRATAQPWDWIAPPFLDISADARDLVKTAFYSAVTPPLRPDESPRDLEIVQGLDPSASADEAEA